MRRWFAANFAGPTEVQSLGWPHIAAGAHTLLLAPTGSGKTLAAFLVALDRLLCHAPAAPGVQVLYVSPLKALVYDIERNLRSPLAGIQHYSEAGQSFAPRVDIRTGDTSPKERRRQARNPGPIMVTTPESLFLLLSSSARQGFTRVHTVIADEVHAIAGSKRGAHLALSLERLSALTEAEPQRIGLSATVQPAEEAARFLAGARAVAIVDAVRPPALDLKVNVPVPDMENIPAAAARSGPRLAQPVEEEPSRRPSHGIWEVLYPAILQEIREANSTIVFVNSRALAERLAQQLNDLAAETIAWAHHGSISHDKRKQIEEGLKAGQVRCIVATSSLELGIDMGAVDRVVMVESPGGVARGLQRVGRAGHRVDARSSGCIYPKYRGDLLEAAVVAERMVAGRIEALAMPRNSLDVLAQQLCAMCCERPWGRAELAALVRRAGPYGELGDTALDAVLEMLSGKYAAAGSLDLPPRLVWDRATDMLSARRGTALLVRANAGTIADRGLYSVHLGPDGPRLGELDEEMVYESRAGEVLALGASSWRVEQITGDRVIVSPAPGEPGRLPFWRGDGPGRPYSLGMAVGRKTREIAAASPSEAVSQLLAGGLLDRHAADNAAAYVHEQVAQAGAVPTDETIVVERFRDELGDWRVCILTPFGAAVHAPWAMALERTLGGAGEVEIRMMYADDGIVIRFADMEALPELDLLFPAADEVEALVVEQLAATARFAALFREGAARALLLPRRRPGQRSALWAQRMRSAQLLAHVRHIPGFPILLETYREALSDVFDMSALRSLLARVAQGRIRVHSAQTSTASPFARSLVFAYVAAFIYDQDAPLAERRAQALSIDKDLLAELVGEEALRDLIDAQVLAEVEARLACLSSGYQARDADEVHDILVRLGDLGETQIAARCTCSPRQAMARLERQKRAVSIYIAGQPRWIAAEDAGLYVHALGCVVPPGLPVALPGETERALERVVARFARRRGPFPTRALAARYGLSVSQAERVLKALAGDGQLVHGQMRPGGGTPEWCDVQVLRRLKRETLAKLRRQIAPVDFACFAAFMLRWHGLEGKPTVDKPTVGKHLDGKNGGRERLLDVLEQLAGVTLPWSMWRDLVLPARVAGFHVDDLEFLCASGRIVWVGGGRQGPRDMRIAFYPRAELTGGGEGGGQALNGVEQAVLHCIEQRGAVFQTVLEAELSDLAEPAAVAAALQALALGGRLTNDTLAPLHTLSAGAPTRQWVPRVSRGLRGRAAACVPGGRWSMVQAGSAAGAEGAAQAALHRAYTLLHRYGIVCREIVLAENIPGGFSALYAVLRQLEESGRIRRGYFVEGLSGAQFALPEAIELLRAGAGERDATLRLISTQDPANLYGTVAAWPEPALKGATKARRGNRNWLVLSGGQLLLYFAAGSGVLTTFQAECSGADELLQALGVLRAIPRAGRGRLLSIETIDGTFAHESALRPLLEKAGFVRDYRGYCAV